MCAIMAKCSSFLSLLSEKFPFKIIYGKSLKTKKYISPPLPVLSVVVVRGAFPAYFPPPSLS